MGLLHAAYGIGATAGPLLVTGLLAAGRTWWSAYGCITGIQVALLVAFLVTRRRWRPAPAEAPAPTGAGTDGVRPLAVLVLTLTAFFVYTGLEIATGQFAFSLLVEQRDLPPTVAGLWVAAYWGALTGGRLLMAVVAHRVAPADVLGGAAAGALAGTVVLWLDAGGAGTVSPRSSA